MSAPKVSAPAPKLIGIREFARRDGCSEKLVRNAKRDGHLGNPAAKMLDAALVGTGWRKSNRRCLDESADTSSADKPKVRTAPLSDVACSLSAMCDAFANDAALVLLRRLPLATVRPMVAELLANARQGAVEMLYEDDIAPPSGSRSWARHRLFTTAVPTEDEWREALEEAGHEA